MLDGVPVHEHDHHWLHRQMSIVGQEPTLYARSIKDNIIYGLEGENMRPLFVSSDDLGHELSSYSGGQVIPQRPCDELA